MKRIRAFGRWIVRIFHVISAEAFRHYAFRREIRSETQSCDKEFETLVAEQEKLAAGLSDPVLNQFENRERERRQSIEAKARTNLVAISLAAAIATALFGLVSEPVSHVVPPAPALLVQMGYAAILVGWIYFLSGGFFAFQVLDVRRTYVLIPRDHYDLEDVTLRATRLVNLEQNQRAAKIMTNALAVSFGAIRNGIVAFAAGVTALTTQLFG